MQELLNLSDDLRGCFLVSAFSQPRALFRQALTDVWRTISIAFRPSFAMRDLERALVTAIQAPSRHY